MLSTVLIFFCSIFVAKEKSEVYLFADNAIGLNLFIHLFNALFLGDKCCGGNQHSNFSQLRKPVLVIKLIGNLDSSINAWTIQKNTAS